MLLVELGQVKPLHIKVTLASVMVMVIELVHKLKALHTRVNELVKLAVACKQLVVVAATDTVTEVA